MAVKGFLFLLHGNQPRTPEPPASLCFPCSHATEKKPQRSKKCKRANLLKFSPQKQVEQEILGAK